MQRSHKMSLKNETKITLPTHKLFAASNNLEIFWHHNQEVAEGMQSLKELSDDGNTHLFLHALPVLIHVADHQHSTLKQTKHKTSDNCQSKLVIRTLTFSFSLFFPFRFFPDPDVGWRSMKVKVVGICKT